MKNLSKNYKLAIVTNGLTDIQNKIIGQSIMSKCVEDIVISEEIKVSKSNPKIFESALNNIGHTDKSKILIVRDRLTSDIQGEINFHIDTCWYNHNEIINNFGIIPTYNIPSLMKLMNILKNV